MSLAEDGYLYSKVYIIQLTKTSVMAHFLYSSSLHFLMKYLYPKHSRIFFTKLFPPQH